MPGPILRIIPSLAAQPLVLGAAQVTADQTTAPTADALGRWSLAMLGLILFSLILLVAWLVVVVLRRQRRNKPALLVDSKAARDIDAWAEAGRRAPTPPPEDDGPDVHGHDPEDHPR